MIRKDIPLLVQVKAIAVPTIAAMISFATLSGGYMLLEKFNDENRRSQGAYIIHFGNGRFIRAHNYTLGNGIITATDIRGVVHSSNNWTIEGGPTNSDSGYAE